MRYLLGDTAAESARRTADLQDAMVERFEPVWRAEISRAMNEMIDAYAVTGSVPHLPDDHERRLSDIWQDMTLIAINAFGGRIVDHGKASGVVLETKSFSEFFQRLALEFVQSEMIRQRIVGIAGTLRRQITTIIADGQQGGQTLPDIVKALRAMEPAISINRARIISRTEIHGASNYGAHEAAKATGLTLRKEWVSVEDYRTRSFDNPDGPAEFSHRAMNGVVVDMDTAFDVPRNDGTTEPMMTPGDPMGSAGNVINCRCQVAHVVIDAVAPRRPNLSYATSKMPRSSAEIGEFILGRNIASRSELAGFPAKKMAEPLRAVLEVKERFDIDPIYSIGPVTRVSRKIQPPKGANAAVYGVTVKDRSTSILHLPKEFLDDVSYERQITIAEIRGPEFRARQLSEINDRGSDEVKAIASKMRQNDYSWTVNDTSSVDASRVSVIYHEMGHVIHLHNTKNPEMSLEINDFLSRSRPIENGWDLLISEYGGSKDVEYIAETFSLYMGGGKSQRYRIHPELLRIYEKWDALN